MNIMKAGGTRVLLFSPIPTSIDSIVHTPLIDGGASSPAPSGLVDSGAVEHPANNRRTERRQKIVRFIGISSR
jgi:hypothetical protein